MSELQRVLLSNIQSKGGKSLAKYSLVNYSNATKISVGDNSIGKFFEEYCNIIYNDEFLSLGEDISKEKDFPIIGNFVFKFDCEQAEEEFFQPTFLENLVESYVTVFRSLFKNYEDKMGLCCTIEMDEGIPDGDFFTIVLRLYFPYIRIDKSYYFDKFRKLLLQQIRRDGVSKLFVAPPIGDWDAWLQEFTESVPLFGSNSEMYPPGKIVKFFDTKFFDPNKFNFIKTGLVPRELIDEESEESKYYPILFSVRYAKYKIAYPIAEEESEDERVKEVTSLLCDETKLKSSQPRDIVLFLLPLLSPHRFKQENFWKDIGRGLYTTFSHDPDTGLKLWIESSVKGKRSAEECEAEWPELMDSCITHRTIGFFAREDCPSGYAKWHQDWVRSSLDEALQLTQDAIALSIYRCFWLDYIYVDKTKLSWMKFEKTHLCPLTKEAIPLVNDIMEKYVNNLLFKFLDAVTKILQDGSAPTRDKTIASSQQSKLLELIKKMKTKSFQDQVIKACHRFFWIPGVEEMLDKSEFLIATKNWVLEVVGHKIVVRSGRPEDYISKTTGNYYHHEWDINNKWVQKLFKMYKQMMVGDEELLDYFLRFQASLLLGGNNDKIAPILTGEGDNGKTVYGRITQSAYGKLCVQFPPEVISARSAMNSSGGARPEIAQAAGARVAFTSEPDEGRMKTNTYKSLTGDDPIFTRGLFEEGGMMMQFFKFILLCNRIPDFTEFDAAIKNRVFIIPFLARFVEFAPEDETEQYRTRTFKRDEDIKKYYRQLGEAHLWLSVHYFTEYRKRSIKANTPKLVVDATARHWEERDPHVSFIRERMEKNTTTDPMKMTKVKKSTLYSSYCEWYSKCYNRKPQANDNIDHFVRVMSHKSNLGPINPKDASWSGWMIKQDTEF